MWENARLSKFVPAFVLDPRSRRRIMAPDDEFNHFDLARVAGTLEKNGVLVNTGAHGQREGLGLALGDLDAGAGGLIAAPGAPLRDGQRARRRSAWTATSGSLEAGKLADLVVIDGNPLQDIRQSEKVTWTMVNGRLYDAATLNETASRERKRAKYWWE